MAKADDNGVEVEDWRRFSESRIGTEFQNVCRAKTTPISDASQNVFSSKVEITEKHVIEISRCD